MPINATYANHSGRTIRFGKQIAGPDTDKPLEAKRWELEVALVDPPKGSVKLLDGTQGGLGDLRKGDECQLRGINRGADVEGYEGDPDDVVGELHTIVVLRREEDDAPAPKASSAKTKVEAPKAKGDKLDSMTVVELREHAHRHGINLHGAATKDEVIAAIRKAK